MAGISPTGGQALTRAIIQRALGSMAGLGDVVHAARSVPIFVINLEEDKGRLEEMEERLGVLGLSYTRYPAYRGAQLPAWLHEQFFDADGTSFSSMSAGQIGCYASHLGVSRRILRDNIAGPVLVLEDDVVFEPELLDVLANLHKLPADWEIVRSSNPPKSAFVPLGRLTSRTEVLRYWRIPMGATAYFINRKGAERIAGKTRPRLRPIDSDLRRFWETGLTTYGLLPLPIRWVANDSSRERIGDDSSQRRRAKFRTQRPGFTALRARWQLFGAQLATRCVWLDVQASVRRIFGVKRRYSPSLRVSPRSPASKS